MEKKSFIVLFLILVSIPIVLSIPQFLIFQGDVKIDGRTASAGTIINFSINETEIANVSVDSSGQYGPVLIQGFKELYGKPINITIINGTDKYEAEQKIYYTYPQDINLNLSTITEKALKISGSFPAEDNIKIQKTGTQTFSITAASGYNDEINYSVFVDGELILDTNPYDYIIGDSDKGIHNITIIANDGFLSVSKEWMLIIERPEIEGFDGATTDFDSLGLDELGNVQNVILEKTGKGKIEFLENLNLSGVTDLTNKVKIERGIAAIDTSFYPQLNKKAKITLYGVAYSTIPEIFYNDGFTTNPSAINKKCDFCTIISYTDFPTTDGTVIFETEHFSSFAVGGSGIKYNVSDFEDLETCSNGKQGDLIIEIKEPDNRDDFGPGEEMEIEVKVKNGADEDKKIIVEAYLYDIDEDEEIENAESKYEEIRDRRSETFKLKMEVPDDFEEDNNYALFVKAYEKGDEEVQCNYDIIDIELEREKHKVIISEITADSLQVYKGGTVEISVEVQNTGSEDEEEVYINVKQEELGISEKSEMFEIERYGDDDIHKEWFSIKIPADSEAGNYDFSIEVVYDSREDSKLATIEVVNKTVFAEQAEVIELTKPEKIISLERGAITGKSIEKKAIYEPKNPAVTLLLILVIGIIIELSAIAIIRRYR